VRFLPLLLANLKRRKIRTLLTIGSFAVAFFLFALLAAIRSGFRQGVDVAGRPIASKAWSTPPCVRSLTAATGSAIKSPNR
jgi:hypothetical protein